MTGTDDELARSISHLGENDDRYWEVLAELKRRKRARGALFDDLFAGEDEES